MEIMASEVEVTLVPKMAATLVRIADIVAVSFRPPTFFLPLPLVLLLTVNPSHSQHPFNHTLLITNLDSFLSFITTINCLCHSSGEAVSFIKHHLSQLTPKLITTTYQTATTNHPRPTKTDWD